MFAPKLIDAFLRGSEEKLPPKEVRRARSADEKQMPKSETHTRYDLVLVMEYVELELYTIMEAAKTKEFLSEKHLKTILYNLLVGLKQLHQMGIMHRDIKPTNILLNSNCEVKIADFGLARGKTSRPKSPHVVTR